MKVTKGSLVMLKVKLEDGLYILAESTLVVSVNIIIVQLSDNDKARLWLMRLVHISARRLNILTNHNLLNGEKN